MTESTYQGNKDCVTYNYTLGLLIETFIGQYQLDVYGYISNTNFKYVIIKNETKTTPLGQKPADDQIKGV